jgi:hypothetical protein
MTLLRLEGFAESLAYRAERLRALLAPFGRCDVIDQAASAIKVQLVQNSFQTD